MTVIPAQPGFFVVYEDQNCLIRGEPIVAWAIEAGKPKDFALDASVYPITPDGRPLGRHVGYEYPDGRVRILDFDFDSLAEAQKAKIPTVTGA